MQESWKVTIETTDAHGEESVTSRQSSDAHTALGFALLSHRDCFPNVLESVAKVITEVLGECQIGDEAIELAWIDVENSAQGYLDTLKKLRTQRLAKE